MKRIVGQALAVTVTAVLAGAAMPACADNDESVFVQHVLAPPQNRQNGVCIYTPDPQAAFQSEGELDVGVRDDYRGIILYGNQMIQRGDPLQTRSESSRFHLDGAVVRVSETNGNIIHEFTSTTSGMAQPQNNNVPGFAVAGITMIDAVASGIIRTGQLPRVVVATIRIFGRTLGGTEVESGDFSFPIRVCNGCLVDYSTGGDPATADPLNCSLSTPAAGGSTTVPNPCTAGQDEATPCQICRLERIACGCRTYAQPAAPPFRECR